MMHRYEDDMLARAELQEENAKRRLQADIKGPASFFGSQLQSMSFKLVRRLFLKIDDRQNYRLCFIDYLYRLIVDRGKDGPQALVPSHHFIEALPNSSYIQRTGETNRGRDVVGGGSRFKLIQKPKSLLRGGQWNRSPLGSPENAPICLR